MALTLLNTQDIVAVPRFEAGMATMFSDRKL